MRPRKQENKRLQSLLFYSSSKEQKQGGCRGCLMGWGHEEDKWDRATFICLCCPFMVTLPKEEKLAGKEEKQDRFLGEHFCGWKLKWGLPLLQQPRQHHEPDP